MARSVFELSAVPARTAGSGGRCLAVLLTAAVGVRVARSGDKCGTQSAATVFLAQ